MLGTYIAITVTLIALLATYVLSMKYIKPIIKLIKGWIFRGIHIGCFPLHKNHIKL